MSNLSDKTEYRALLVIAQIVREFEKLHCLNMTKLDDFDAILARNLLQSIIESNGYKVNYDRDINKPLLK